MFVDDFIEIISANLQCFTILILKNLNKTYGNILQVSQLMILYEEAQGGTVTGDLSQLLEAVSAAVQNLVQVSFLIY